MINRRMVGHGNLAERAVLSVMPETEDFPYTTRVSAEVRSIAPFCPIQSFNQTSAKRLGVESFCSQESVYTTLHALTRKASVLLTRRGSLSPP